MTYLKSIQKLSVSVSSVDTGYGKNPETSFLNFLYCNESDLENACVNLLSGPTPASSSMFSKDLFITVNWFNNQNASS